MEKNSLRQNIYEYVKKKYKTEPEYPWQRFPSYAVFRHNDNRKWYSLIMNIPRSKIMLGGEEYIDILNIKLDDILLRDMLIQQEGFYIGYHISKGNWISILLDGTVQYDMICNLIDISYRVTASKQEKQKLRPPQEWLVPANPHYYDIENAFEDVKVIDWKQGKGIKKDDKVFLYAGAPISAILYKCKVIEIDIPYNYQNKNLTITKVMKIKLMKRYKPDKFTFSLLKNKYGIAAIRGPRGVPDNLSAVL